jgi:hypothetical protein
MNNQNKSGAPKPIGRQSDKVGQATTETKESTGYSPASSGENLTGDALAMKKELEKAPKVSYYIPLGIGEKKGAYETVTLNGYKLTIKKGVRVEIPKPMAIELDRLQGIQEEIGLDQRIDLSDKEKQDALS